MVPALAGVEWSSSIAYLKMSFGVLLNSWLNSQRLEKHGVSKAGGKVSGSNLQLAAFACAALAVVSAFLPPLSLFHRFQALHLMTADRR